MRKIVDLFAAKAAVAQLFSSCQAIYGSLFGVVDGTE